MKKTRKPKLQHILDEMKPKSARKARVAKLNALALLSVIEHSQANFIQGSILTPYVVSIHGPSLRRHFDPKMTSRAFDALMRTLLEWRMFLTFSYCKDVYVVTLNPPRGMKWDLQDHNRRLPPTLPNLATVVKSAKKAKVLEMTIEKMTLEALTSRGDSND